MRNQSRSSVPGVGLLCALLLTSSGGQPQEVSTRSLPPLSREEGAGGDAPDYRFTNLSSEDGLSDDDVRSILQDRQGFLWFGTEQGGLNRYDGYELKVYQADPQDDRSLIHNFVWVLYEDRRGTLWVGTNGGGLDKYDRDTDSFVHHRHDPRDPASLPHDNVKSLLEDRAGVLWVGSDGGLSRFDRDTGKFSTLRHDPADPGSLGDDSVRAILEDSNGLLWLGTRRGGVSVLDPKSGRFTRYRHDPADPGSLSNDAVDHLFPDRSGAVWCSTREGLSRFDPGRGSFVRYRHDAANPSSLGDDYVSMVHEDRSGRLWVATLNGLDLFDPRTDTFRHYRHETGDPESLGDDDLTTLYEDRQGGLWVGTVSGGVSRLAAGAPRFLTYRHSPLDPASLSHSVVQALAVSRTGTLWVGTGGGLNRFQGGRFTRLLHEPRDPRTLSHDDVRAIAEDSHGVLWIGTWGGGLNRFDGRTFTRYRSAARDPTTIGGDFIDALHADDGGGLWIAVHGVGLDRFDGKTFTHYRPDPGDPKSLPSHYVLPIVGGGDGALWLGTTDMGLVHLDPATGVFTRYLLDPGRPGSEAANRVNAISSDPRGDLWLGTIAGLVRFEPASRSFTTRFTRNDGLASNTILGVLGDDQGQLWLSTPAGLSRCDPQRGTLRNYDRTDGLQSNQFVARAHARAPDGRMFFGGLRGFNAFRPETVVPNPHIPPVVLTDLEVFDKRAEVSEKGSPLQRAIHVAEVVRLRHDQSVFSLKFAALDYTSPARNRYAYKMEGFDTAWRQTGADRRLVTYTNLNPDSYVFRVRASNSDGIWNEAGTSLRVVIMPPWWATWWFRTLASAAILALSFSVYRLRVGTLKERERRFRTLAENAPDIVARFDRDLRFRYINPAAHESTGLAPAAFLGKTNGELGLPAESVAAVESALRKVFDTGTSAVFEFEFKTPKGVRSFESRLVPEAGTDGAPRSVLGITRDLTERKHAEEEQARFQESLRRSQTMAEMGTLVAGVAHEVRNPLFIISANLDALEAQTSAHDPYRQYSDVLRDAVERMNRLMHELLAYGQPAAPQFAEHPVEGLIAEALFSCEARAQRSNVRLENRVRSGFPAISMERGRLLQVFQNLIENAIQHSPQGGTVSVEARADGDHGSSWIRFAIEDQGPGFREEDLPRVFEPFFTRRPGGTGLGLSIVQRIVEEHHGTIQASNRPEGGALMVVRLPVTPA